MVDNLPENKEWDHFWSSEKNKDLSKISWSKKRIISELKPFLPGSKKVLDAGCGSGFFSKFFCDNDFDTTSLDYSDEALEIAYKVTNGKSKIVKKDLLQDFSSDEQQEKYDLIFSDGLFEHFSNTDQDKIMQNFKSILSDKGVVATFVPNKWSPWQIIRPLYMPGIVEKPFVINPLIELNEKNGLNVIRSGGINTFPFGFSPDAILGKTFGMLLFTISRK